MNTATSGAAPTPQTTEKISEMSGNISDFSDKKVTVIPEVLRDYIQIDEDDDTSVRLPARDGNRRIGMLTIPEIQFTAWKTCFPKGMEKGPQSRYRQSRRVFFSIDDLPADAPTSITNGEPSVFFSGYPSSIPTGEWSGNPPAEFMEWARAVGIEIIGKLEDFMARNSLLVARFYNEIAAGYECCKKQARIAGRVMRSVFIGWELRDEDADEADRQDRRRIPQPVNPVMQGDGDGLRRHMEFMSEEVCSLPTPERLSDLFLWL